MNLKPINKKVIAKRCEPKENKKGSLILVAGDKQKSNTATVIAVADDVTEVKEGDVVLMERYSQEIEIEEDTYLILRIEELIGIF